jgi:hypothetical protein
MSSASLAWSVPSTFVGWHNSQELAYKLQNLWIGKLKMGGFSKYWLKPNLKWIQIESENWMPISGFVMSQ